MKRTSLFFICFLAFFMVSSAALAAIGPSSKEEEIYLYDKTEVAVNEQIIVTMTYMVTVKQVEKEDGIEKGVREIIKRVTDMVALNLKEEIVRGVTEYLVVIVTHQSPKGIPAGMFEFNINLKELENLYKQIDDLMLKQGAIPL